jgi:hypothetical protein
MARRRAYVPHQGRSRSSITGFTTVVSAGSSRPLRPRRRERSSGVVFRSRAGSSDVLLLTVSLVLIALSVALTFR